MKLTKQDNDAKELEAFKADARYDDEMRSRIMDQLVIQANGNPKAFEAGVLVLMAGWLSNYRG